MRNEGGGFAASIYGRCPKVAFSHQSQVTSHQSQVTSHKSLFTGVLSGSPVRFLAISVGTRR